MILSVEVPALFWVLTGLMAINLALDLSHRTFVVKDLSGNEVL